MALHMLVISKSPCSVPTLSFLKATQSAQTLPKHGFSPYRNQVHTKGHTCIFNKGNK